MRWYLDHKGFSKEKKRNAVKEKIEWGVGRVLKDHLHYRCLWEERHTETSPVAGPQVLLIGFLFLATYTLARNLKHLCFTAKLQCCNLSLP